MSKRMHRNAVRWEDLSRLISAKRKTEVLTLEQAAQQAGVSAATLSRWERHAFGRGQLTRTALPDMRTLTAVANWLNVSLDRIVEIDKPTSEETPNIVHHQGETTPDMVAAHLRADPNLNPDTAAALARAFRAIYEQFANIDTQSDQRASREENETTT